MQCNRIWALVFLLIPACATATPEDRRAYILAHPHGWLEVTISDASIPDVPEHQSDPESEPAPPPVWERPSRCLVEVSVDGEPFLADSVYPQGERAPYRVESGFRFPVPVGSSIVRFAYTGCRAVSGRVWTFETERSVEIEQDATHELVFDGEDLLARIVRPPISRPSTRFAPPPRTRANARPTALSCPPATRSPP